jgi:PAS domain S-box-containing protein
LSGLAVTGRGRLTAAAVVALAEAGGAVAIVASSHHESQKVLAGSLVVTSGLSFVGSGLVALHRRPGNRTGVYLAAVGYLWFLAALTDANNDVMFTIGAIVSNVAFIPFAALILAFPGGKLEVAGRRLVAATAWFVLIGPPTLMLFTTRGPADCSGNECPHSAIVVFDNHTVETIIESIATAITVVLVALAVMLVARRWRSSTAPARRVLFPVYTAGTATLIALSLTNVLSQADEHANTVLGPVFLAFFATVPFAFLGGILRSRLARASIAELMVALEHGRPLRSAIAEAMGDPSLGLAFWLENRERYVDQEGRTLDLSNVPDRTMTVVERDGRLVGALLHDESLGGEPELIESVSAAVAFALDNERLQADVRAQHEYLMTIVNAAPSLLVNLDIDGRIQHLNPATLAASGYDDENAVRGQFFWDIFIDPSERESMVARFRASAPEHPPAEYENTFMNRRGERVAVIWRGAPVSGDSGDVESIIAAGLDVTAHRRQEEEIRASRGRIVAAGDEARRRLERNLHDGAQQRLVSLSLSLRLAQSKLANDPDATASILSGASEELAFALEELRELARGIHPALLTDRGLDAALEGLAARSPIPIELDRLGRRLPERIEAAAYYVVSESIANVVKHAAASEVRVGLHAENGHVVIEVVDDGVGGADAAGGSGLRGLTDRVAALDGTLAVDSPSGGGTRVVAEIPITSVPASE